MDRAERTGLGIAVVAHAALFAALSLNLLKPPVLPKLDTDPIEVSLTDEVALESTSPTPSVAQPEPAPAPIEPSPPAPQEIAPPPPEPVVKPLPKPVAKPIPKPVAKTLPKPVVKPPSKPVVQQKPQPPKPQKPVVKPQKPRPGPGLSPELVKGYREQPGPKPAKPDAAPPGKVAGPAVQASLGAEVRRQLKPHWKSPSGADVELLRTTVSARLNRDGSIAGAPEIIAQTGVNDSNRAQAKLHADQAIRAVRLAAPFKLPAEYYDAWKEIRPVFDKRLSQ